MIKVGSRVLTISNRWPELIGLNGTVEKEWNIKPEYTDTLGEKIFRVRFDKPIDARGHAIELGLFKECELQII